MNSIVLYHLHANGDVTLAAWVVWTYVVFIVLWLIWLISLGLRLRRRSSTSSK